jgi:PAS domain S-box-containing protein
MGRISSTIRITIGLVGLAVAILLGGYSIGLVPDREAAVTAGRQDLCEALAIQCSALTSHHNTRLIPTVLKATCQRNRDMLFAAVYCRDGTLLAVDGDNAARLHNNTTHDATECRMTVPILEGSQTWGSLEVIFRPLVGSGLRGLLRRDIVRLTLAVAAASLISYFVYLRRLLQDLDPSKVIPQRVRDTLDTFAEGLLVMDSNERIVLANRSFAKIVGRAADDLQGHRASDLPWVSPEGQTENQDKKTKSYPWQRAIDQGEPQIGRMLSLCLPGSERRAFLVNASPILNNERDTHGALASFDDVTAMERNREALCRALKTLKKSKDDVHRKNLELEKLASHDPLTSCLNRRAFFSAFETQWGGARRHGYPLAYVMVDIDHFKAVNDQHGHQVGDDVLQKIADVLNSTVRQGDIVCRYGGE